MKNFITQKYIAIILWAVAIVGVQYVQLGEFQLVPFVLALIICTIMEVVKDKFLKNYMTKKDASSSEN